MAAAGLNPGAEHRMVLKNKSWNSFFFISIVILFRQENDIIKI